MDAACEEYDEKNATDNDFFLHIMETLWSGGLKNVFKITCFFAFNFLFAENICGRKAAIQATLCDICATGVLKTLARDKMQLWPVWSVQRLKCYGRGFFHILKRLGIGIVSFIERVSTTITAQGVNKQPNILNTAIFF